MTAAQLGERAWAGLRALTRTMLFTVKFTVGHALVILAASLTHLFRGVRASGSFALSLLRAVTPPAAVVHSVVHTGTILLLGLSLLLNLAVYEHWVTVESPEEKAAREAADIFNSEAPLSGAMKKPMKKKTTHKKPEENND